LLFVKPEQEDDKAYAEKERKRRRHLYVLMTTPAFYQKFRSREPKKLRPEVETLGEVRGFAFVGGAGRLAESQEKPYRADCVRGKPHGGNDGYR
jgi:hypothetical protein